MPQKEYEYESGRSELIDLEDGHIQIRMGYLGDRAEEYIAHAKWLDTIGSELYAKYQKSQQILVDLGNLDTIPLSDALRQEYERIMAQGRVEKIAIVGNLFILVKAVPVMRLLTKQGAMTKFFFRINDAKDWLGW